MEGRVIGAFLRVAPSPHVGRGIVRLPMAGILRRDMTFGGSYRVTGIVTSDGQPVRRRVRLHDQRSGNLVKEQWSDAVTGRYTFDHVGPGPWIAIALDHTGQFDPAAKADLNAEPMP